MGVKDIDEEKLGTDNTGGLKGLRLYAYFTFVQTISTGMPRLCVSVFSLSGSTTASSSPAVGARLCGEDGLASSGSVYSWNAFTTKKIQERN